ncbi:ribokinase [Pseudoxanthomonas sp. Root630]|uniref:ribokinase n=1 Tax=Pseudoxanthomonas sp. Root630 TaxID=1736574 RepID=UPI0007025E4B|nr:ribokinase [Pseudoxanthomonas sp. Root630]KRA46721.1 ribokinase [Pseudoxanthomonas sp. Root630]
MNTPSPSPARVIIVGSFNVDHVWRCDALPAAGATIAGRYASGPGGKGFNQAIAAVRAGAETTFVCALGDDAGGRLARDLAAADGLDLRAQASDEPTGTAGIYVDAHGRNTIVIGAGANAALSTEHANAQSAVFAEAKVVLAQLESPADTVLATLQTARQHGAMTVLNPAPANAATTTELLAHADVVTPNETEFAALLARHLGERVSADDVATLDGVTLHQHCRQLFPHGTVVVTLGSTGVYVSHPDDALRGDPRAHYRVAAEAATVVDTTGAGDAFNGALAASLAENAVAAFADHVRFANRYAALSTERPGAALAMPLLADLQTRFAD